MAAIGFLSTLAFGDRCSGKRGKRTAAGPGRGKWQIWIRKGAIELSMGGSGVRYGVVVNLGREEEESELGRGRR